MSNNNNNKNMYTNCNKTNNDIINNINHNNDNNNNRNTRINVDNNDDLKQHVQSTNMNTSNNWNYDYDINYDDININSGMRKHSWNCHNSTSKFKSNEHEHDDDAYDLSMNWPSFQTLKQQISTDNCKDIDDSQLEAKQCSNNYNDKIYQREKEIHMRDKNLNRNGNFNKAIINHYPKLMRYDYEIHQYVKTDYGPTVEVKIIMAGSNFEPAYCQSVITYDSVTRYSEMSVNQIYNNSDR